MIYIMIDIITNINNNIHFDIHYELLFIFKNLLIFILWTSGKPECIDFGKFIRERIIMSPIRGLYRFLVYMTKF